MFGNGGVIGQPLGALGLGLAVGGEDRVIAEALRRLGARDETATGYALITPWLAGFLLWTLYPIVASFYLSFTEYDVLQSPAWVGLRNYTRIFAQDIDFWPSIRITVL